jgi:peptidoglycan/xylan/chitin deacetylase (PgdA/CDA1 family)
MFPELAMEARSEHSIARITVDPSVGKFWKVRPPRRGQIALTFDDGPHPVSTPAILKILDQHQIKANFFLTGEHARQYPELAQQIVQQGHIVGSHSLDHPDLTALSQQDAQANIIAGHDAVRVASGTQTPFFRFPYLRHNEELASFVASVGLLHFLQDIDSQDWCAESPNKIIDVVCDRYGTINNGIIVLHDCLEITVEALSPLIDRLSAKAKFVYFDWDRSLPDRFALALSSRDYGNTTVSSEACI